MYQHAFTGELISMRLRILRLQVLEIQKQLSSSLVSFADIFVPSRRHEGMLRDETNAAAWETRLIQVDTLKRGSTL